MHYGHAVVYRTRLGSTEIEVSRVQETTTDQEFLNTAPDSCPGDT